MTVLIYPSLQAPVLTPAQAVEQVMESKWHQPWSDPLQTINRKKIATIAIVLMASGPFQPPQGFEKPTFDKWGYQWEQPYQLRLNQKAKIATASQQFLAFQLTQSQQPEAVLESKWHQPWSEPVKPVNFKKGLLPPWQMSATGDTANTLLPRRVPTWFAWLSDPVRLKPGLGSWLQQGDPLQVPVQPVTSRLIQWFSPLSEPVHLPVGLKSWLQQTTAYHPRILPNPDVTGTMNGIETNEDVALFGINVYSGSSGTGAVASANVSIAEIQANNSGFGSIEET